MSENPAIRLLIKQQKEAIQTKEYREKEIIRSRTGLFLRLEELQKVEIILLEVNIALKRLGYNPNEGKTV